MKSSNSFLSGPLIVCLALCSSGGIALALDPGRPVSQYIRDHWGPEKGFPGGSVYAITQTLDGYLWIGAEAGLIRFDGLNFALIQPPDAQGLSINHILGLTADADGSLWLRLGGPTLVHYRDGVFTVVSPDPKNPEPMVTAMVLSTERQLLVSSRLSGVAVLRGKAFEPVVTETSLPRGAVVSVAQSPNGEIWLGTLDKGLIRVRGKTVSTISLGAKEPEINCLLPEADGQMWIGTDRGLLKWNGSAIAPTPLAQESVVSLARDRDSNIWAGTATRGAFRLNAAGVSPVEQSGPPSPVTAVFEDREGNLWMGAGNGIDRLRESFFVNYSEPAGLPSDGNGSVYADARGTIWWAPASGGLYSLRNGKATRITQAGLNNGVIYSITGGDGELWLGRQYGGLTHLHWPNGTFRTQTYTHKDGLAQDTVYVAEETRDGSVWAGTVNAGASLFRNGQFQSYDSAVGLAANIVTSILESSSGVTWFAGPSGLTSLTQGRWKVFRTSDGLPSVVINCLYEDSSGVIWIGTMHGVAAFRSGRIAVPVKTPDVLRSQIFGIAGDQRGSLWIATGDQVVRVSRNKLLAGEVEDHDVRAYGSTEGLKGISTAKRHRSIVTDPQGRIWLSMDRGLSMIDPLRLAADSAPTIVHIENVSVAGENMDLRSKIRFTARRQRVTIRYTGLNLAAPDRIRFRFVLEGNDKDWNEPGHAREAVYTNLTPGPYRFRVTASNADGVWNGSDATIDFRVDPEFWQTWWFRASAILVAGLVISALYRMRLEEMRRRFNIRLEERLAERTRIARDLHDNLLQTIQGSKLLVDGALVESTGDSAGRQVLERLSGWLDRAIVEGRTAVNSLRVSKAQEDCLSESLRQAAVENLVHTSMKFSLSVEGAARAFRPIVRDEILHIGCEAIRNACKHSGGTRLEVELNYGRNFAMRVLDDGIGIQPEVAANGKPGHFGLRGMQERATSLDGKLSLFSSPNSGTEIELVVPGASAYKGKS